MTLPDITNRQEEARMRRILAAEKSTSGDVPEPRNNGQEKAPYLYSFRKGLHHDPKTGLLVDPDDYKAFAEATVTPDPFVWANVSFTGTCNCVNVPASIKDCAFREWESPTAGLDYVLEGPDPLSLAIPPAPAAGSTELLAEMAEVYQMALHRDLPTAAFMPSSLVQKVQAKLPNKPKKALGDDHDRAAKDAARLGTCDWFQGQPNSADATDRLERARRRFGANVNIGCLYRGLGEDKWDTPFVSQFMLVSSDADHPETGEIRFGNQIIHQDVRKAQEKRDFMTGWSDWIAVQNGLNTRKQLEVESAASGGALLPEFETSGGKIVHRPIATLRDLASYVHDDELAQAYFNAAQILLARQFKLDKGLPYHDGSTNGVPGQNRTPFAVFGRPHLDALLWSVAAPALRAVRATKFSVHRRLRPEALGALFHTVLSGYDPNFSGVQFDLAHAVEGQARRSLGNLIAPYVINGQPNYEAVASEILTEVRKSNEAANTTPTDPNPANSWLLPMAFPEGSPMHPAYGAGHATVAGACVTLLKAFFEMGTTDEPTWLVEPGGNAFVGHDDGTTTRLIGFTMEEGLTLKGELNKLAWNISNARNIAGVHYYSDYSESVLLGETVTLGVLREQMLTYHHGQAYAGSETGDANVSMTVPLFTRRTLPDVLLDGANFGSDDPVSVVKICKDGSFKKLD